MDLSSIMNSDASGAAKPQHPPAHQSPARQSSEPLHTPRPAEVSTPGPSYASGYFARPSQPSNQPPQHSPSASSTYISTHSPYQRRSTTAVGGGTPSHHAQSSPTPTYQLAPRDLKPTSPAAFAPPALASPYTPQSVPPNPQYQQPQQQSYFSHHPSPHPAQHAPGPQSAPGYSPQPHASESPRAVSAHQPFQPQQQISPPAQRSQPGTPLGPPAGPYQRPHQSVRPPSAGDKMPVQPSHPYNSHEHHGPDQRTWGSQSYQAGPPSLPNRDSRVGERPNSSQFPPESDRERSVSISPKTIVSRQSLSQDRDGIVPHRTSMDDDRWRQSPSGSHSHSSSVAEHAKHSSHTPQPQPSHPHGPQAMQMSSSPLMRQTPSRETSSAPPQPIKSEVSEVAEVSGRPAKRKKVRYDEPPIYARRVPRASQKGPIIPAPRPPIPKHSPERLHLHRRSISAQGSAPSPSTASLQTPARQPPVNGSINTPPNGRSFVPPPAPVPGPVPAPAPPEPAYGLLGPWEPSISGKIPYEEITKVVCDFLFKEVVLRRDLAAGAAGASATGPGAILEIEAKLGQIVDKERGGRLRLPVMTECVINSNNSDFRTAFESSMSLAQHRVMNNFLNEAVKASMPQAGLKRIPLSYAHKKERDTFYEVPLNELPPLIQNYLNPRHKPKVRVTTDQKTGDILAKIIKCRIADLDVYSPSTNVDWRISVNLEMNFDRDVQQFPISEGGGGRGRERIKDRMSYRHLAYQIDLTQVGTADGSAKNDFEHELEVELSAAEVRRQGELAMAGNERNQYEELVKGFVDNVRVLARNVPHA